MIKSQGVKFVGTTVGAIAVAAGLAACGGSTASSETERLSAGAKTRATEDDQINVERRIAGSDKPGRLIFTQSKGTDFGAIGNHSFGSGEFHVSKASDLEYMRVVPDCSFWDRTLDYCKRITVRPTMKGDTLDVNGPISFTGGWYKDSVDQTVYPGSSRHIAVGKAGDKKGHYLWATVSSPDANNAIRIHFNVGREAKVS